MKHLKTILATLALLMTVPGSAMAFFGIGVADDWHATAAHKPLPAMHFVIPARDLSRVCRTNPAATTYGCALRDYAANVCIIYTAKNPPQWLMDHERKHCDGWDHGDEPRQAAAVNLAEVSGS